MSVKVSYTEAERIDIPVGEYNYLVRQSERIEAVRRFANHANGYVTTADVLALLGIEKEPTEGEKK